MAVHDIGTVVNLARVSILTVPAVPAHVKESDTLVGHRKIDAENRYRKTLLGNPLYDIVEILLYGIIVGDLWAPAQQPRPSARPIEARVEK